jgi:hypothetical protein
MGRVFQSPSAYASRKGESLPHRFATAVFKTKESTLVGMDLQSGTCFEALRPSERVHEHNIKCTKAKGEGPHDSLRETRARHAPAADAGRTRHRAAGALPPAASEDRVLLPVGGLSNMK